MILHLLLILSISVIASSQSKTYKLFLLKESSEKNIYIDTIVLSEGKNVVISQTNFITFILPLGFGKSGDIIQESQRNNKIKILASNEQISITIIKTDGSKRELPSININDLQKYFIRVNVTTGNGIKKAFYIKNYNEYGIAEGPVIDMFGGKIPLGKNDFSVTTEVTEIMKQDFISGSAPLEIYSNLLFIKGKINNMKENYFIIDFGAGRSVFSKEFIPSENEISAVESIEYSSEGTKILKGEIGALGGDVSDFLGNTVIKNFRFGNIVIENFTASVLKKLPLIADKTIAGIIGMDILMKSPIVKVEYNLGKGGKIFFEENLKAGNEDIEIPFSLTGKQIFIDGKINNKNISFLFDTGARYSFVSKGLGFETIKTKSLDIRGLDGNNIAAEQISVESFFLGDKKFDPKTFYSADLNVINSMGLKDSGALLGGDFLGRFKTVTIDFKNKKVYLLK